MSLVIELKGIETPRAPTDRVQGSLLDVVNDAAKVVLVSEYFCQLHRFGIDLVDDGRAVWPVFGNRRVDRLAVVVDAARMIDRPFAQGDVLKQVSCRINLEQVSLALARIAIIAISGLVVFPGRLRDLDRRDVEVIANLHHALGMKRREIERNLAGRLPRGVAVERFEPLAYGSTGIDCLPEGRDCDSGCQCGDHHYASSKASHAALRFR